MMPSSARARKSLPGPLPLPPHHVVGMVERVDEVSDPRDGRAVLDTGPRRHQVDHGVVHAVLLERDTLPPRFRS